MTLMMSSGRRRAAAVAPAFVTSPVISGTYSIGSVLTCAPGTWTGTAPVTPTYQWQRDGIAIGGETASTYTVVSADMTATVTCVVTITNSAGSDVDESNGLSWADYVATLGARVRLDPRGGTNLILTGSLIDQATDVNGTGNHATMSGGNRPSYDPTAFGGRGGMLFAAASLHRLVTPAFAMGARSSGAIVWRPTGDNQTAFEFGATFDQHGYLLCSGGGVRLRRAPAGGEVNIATTYPQQWRVIWRMDDTGVRALFNGTVRTLGAAAGKPPALTAPLYLGAIQGGVTFPLDGHIGEMIFADALWSDAMMDAVDAAFAARWF